jgi:hypothetical protein
MVVRVVDRRTEKQHNTEGETTMARRKKVTKKMYSDLYDHPESLFDGLETRIFPRQRETIWIGTPDGSQSFLISASKGSAGISLRIRAANIVGAETRTRVYDSSYTQLSSVAHTKEIEVTNYLDTEEAREFSAWYDADATAKDARALQANIQE